jgi:formiminotetrahydrofolate cyclodeaminase
MSKKTDNEKRKRSQAIQKGYKTASMIPLKTAKTCENIFNLSKIIAEKGNKNSITDTAVSAIMAKSGILSAILNVKINLDSIKDEKFVKNISNEINDIEKNALRKSDEIQKIVNKRLLY